MRPSAMAISAACQCAVLVALLGFPCPAGAYSNWVNGWDNPVTINCANRYGLTALQSAHHNRHEDRLWSYECGGAYGSASQGGYSGYVNNWDQAFTMSCTGNRVMSGLMSYHHNRHEDRRWRFRCSNTIPGTTFDACGWTGYTGGMDSHWLYRVPYGYFIRALNSYHHNGREDRQWKIYQCRTKCTAGYGLSGAYNCGACPANKYMDSTNHRSPCKNCASTHYAEGVANTGCTACSVPMANCKSCANSKVCTSCYRNINNNPGYFIYKVYTPSYPDQCREACSHWGSSTKICYPGKCASEFIGGCRCAPGFSGTGCNTITVAPGLSGCFASLKKGGSAVSNVEDFCLAAFHGKTFYTNTHDTLTLDMSVNNGPLGNAFKASDYPINTQSMPNADQKFGNLIASMKVGIQYFDVRVYVRKFTGGSFSYRAGYSSSPTNWNCGGSFRATPTWSAPITSSVTCRLKNGVGISLTGLGLVNGDQVKIMARAYSGGHLKYRNRETNGQSTRIFSRASSATNEKPIFFRIDTSKPYICNEDVSRAMQVTTGRITKQSTLRITSAGFRDRYSGVKQVRWYIYRMKHRIVAGKHTLEEEHVALKSGTVVPSVSSYSPCRAGDASPRRRRGSSLAAAGNSTSAPETVVDLGDIAGLGLAAGQPTRSSRPGETFVFDDVFDVDAGVADRLRAEQAELLAAERKRGRRATDAQQAVKDAPVVKGVNCPGLRTCRSCTAHEGCGWCASGGCAAKVLMGITTCAARRWYAPRDNFGNECGEDGKTNTVTIDTKIDGVQGDPNGLYAVHVVYEDGAHKTQPNHLIARRMVLYMPSSTLVQSGSLALSGSYQPNTQPLNELWWNNGGQPGGTSLTVDFANHFYNNKLSHQSNWLNPVDPYASGADYLRNLDQISGALPVAGTAHYKGIVRYRGTLLDAAATTPPNSQLPIFPGISPRRTFAVSGLTDGKEYKAVVSAEDVMGTVKTSTLRFRPDRTAPRVTELALEAGGEKGLLIHDSGDLSKMDISVSIEDEDSGLMEIRWTISTSPTITSLSTIASASLAAATMSAGCEPHCRCMRFAATRCYKRFYDLPLDSHGDLHPSKHLSGDGSTVYVTVQAKNRANLWATSRIAVKVDSSPPLAGIVTDNRPGQNDLDFTQAGQTLYASFTGFGDPESGIRHYLYSVGTSCQTDVSAFLASNPAKKAASAAWISYRQSRPGTYYVSVLAYNNAMQPTRLVCSDGITVDSSPPSLEYVRVDHTYVRPGFAALDAKSPLYLVRSDRTRVQIRKSGCAVVGKTARVDRFLESLPLAREGNTSTPLQLTEAEEREACAAHGQAGPVAMHYARGSRLTVSYTGADEESGIRDFYTEVLPPSILSNPEVRPLKARTAAHHREMVVLQDVAIEEGSVFYVRVTAVNNAGMQRALLAGPFQVDTLRPSAALQAPITLRPLVVSGTLRVSVPTLAFPEGASAEYAIALGVPSDPTSVTPYTSVLPRDGRPVFCTASGPSSSGQVSCPVYSSVSKLALNSAYVISVRATYPNGQVLVAAVDYQRTSADGSARRVCLHRKIDVDQETTDTCPEYLSVPAAPTAIDVSWHGFENDDAGEGWAVVVTATAPEGNVVWTGRAQARPGDDQTTIKIGRAFATGTVLQARVTNTATNEGTSSADGVLISGPATTATGVRVCDRTLEPPDASAGDGTCAQSGEAAVHDVALSTNHVAAAWTSSSLPFVTHYQLAVAVRGAEGQVEAVSPYVDVSSATAATAHGLALEDGVRYYAAVKACFAGGCYDPVLSDGFRVVNSAPRTGSLNAVVTSTPSLDSAQLVVQWDHFVSADGEPITDYEFAVAQSADEGHLLTPWIPVTQAIALATSQWTWGGRVSVRVPAKNNGPWRQAAALGKPLYVVVRGSGPSGLSSETAGRVVVPKGLTVSRPVWDARPSDSHEPAAGGDIDFTSADRLAATWADLPAVKAGKPVPADGALYSWSATVGEKKWYTCQLPDTPQPPPPNRLACGTTRDALAATPALELLPDTMYYMCVRALATGETHCSDGVRVDASPPTPGEIRFRGVADAAETQAAGMQSAGPQAHVQAAANVVAFEWDAFGDAERDPVPDGAHPPATSAVAGYEYALGTAPGQTDVVPWTAAGTATSAVAAGLRLSRGVVYYASVRATDQAGLSSVATTGTGVLVDDTPPTGGQVTEVSVALSRGGLVVAARWTPVEDGESGLAALQWALGSQPYLSDIRGFAAAGDTGDEGAAATGVRGLVAGQRFYVTVRAVNHGGLHATATSPQVIADYSPPLPGAIMDGPRGKGDVRYQASTSRAAVHWVPFAEPESAVTSYAWCLGTASGLCDVRGFEPAGVAHEAAADVALAVGVRYFASVRGCNSAGLCAVGSSDGFMVDDTPPIVGRVFDGLRGEDVAFQGTDSVLMAHWAGFHDPQTGVLGYRWCAGLAAGRCDVVGWQDAYQREEGVLLLPADGHLEPRVTLYLTVEATNWAGLTASASSNGFRVDATPPAFRGSPAITSAQRRLTYRTFAGDTATLAMPANTQVDPSLITGGWSVADGDSGVVSTSWSLRTHLGGDPTVDPALSGGMTSVTAAGLELASGDSYELLVSACNAAGVCATAVSPPVLVDYTAPYGGAFDRFHAVEAATLSSTRPVVKFGWAGFMDPESEVKQYRVEVRVKNLYGRADNLAFQRTYTHVGSQTQRQLAVVGPLILSGTLFSVWRQGLYISVYPVNGVGTAGRPLTAHLRASSNYLETYIDSCMAADCSGSCACQPVNAPCDIAEAQPPQAPCAEKSSVAATAMATAFVGVSSAEAAAAPSPTASTAVLTGGWVTAKYPETATRYEVTGGHHATSGAALPPGSGLFDLADDLVWQDPGSFLSIHELVFPPTSRRMLAGQQYKLFVRAFADRNTIRTVASRPVLCDPSPPVVLPTSRVLDLLSAAGRADVDFADAVTELHTSWAGVFHDAQSGLDRFTVGLGTFPGAADVGAWAQLPGAATRHRFTGLRLLPNTRYFFTVHATNAAGLSTFAASDGITVDVSPPVAGHVRHGTGLVHEEHQVGDAAFAANWNGFLDPESAVVGYEWALGTAPGRDDIQSFTSVGLATRVRSSKTVAQLAPGKSSFVVTVRATNSHGRRTSASSPAVTVDSTPPVGFKCAESADNLLGAGGDFEQGTSCGGKSPCFKVAADGSQADARVGSPASPAFRGSSWLALQGTMAASVSGLIVGEEYRFIVHARNLGGALHDTITVGITGLQTTAFHVRVRPGAGMWQRFGVALRATAPSVTVTLATTSASGVGVDDVQLVHCKLASPSDGDDVFATNHHFFSSTDHVRIAWTVGDPHSGIRRFRWAAGTRPGGQQVVPFTDVGASSTAEVSGLGLAHGSSLFFTVMAENGAGLQSVFTSAAATVVDLSPPIVTRLHDSGVVNDGDRDRDYVRTDKLHVQAVAVDSESGVDVCDVAVGRAPGAVDVSGGYSPMSVVSKNAGGGTFQSVVSIAGKAPVGSVLYSTARCRNGAGLVTHAISNGIRVIPPLRPSLALTSPSETMYSRAGGRDVQSQKDSLRVAWVGDTAGVKQFEMKVGSGAYESVGLAHGSDINTTWTSDLDVSVRAVFHDASTGAAAKVTAKRDSTAPKLADNAKISAEWGSSGLTVGWADMFTESGPSKTLRYEVSLGSFPFATNMAQWISTSETSSGFSSQLFSRPRPVYYVRVVAVNAAGLWTEHTEKITGPL